MTSQKTEIGTTIFWSEQYGIPPAEYDNISHFYDESQWYRVQDCWGKTGWVVGYRDKVITGTHKYRCGERNSSFGGQFWILYDHDHSIGGLDPEKLQPISY